VEVQRVAEVVAVPDARDRVLAADYVVAKSGDQGPSFAIHDTPTLTAELCEGRGQLGRLFERLRVYRLPDRSKAFLFHRRMSDKYPSSPLRE
jgi:hypothetical protein